MNQPVLKPIGEYPNPVPTPVDKPLPSGREIGDFINQGVQKSAAIGGKAALNTLIQIAPYLPIGLGFVPLTTRNPKTPFGVRSVIIGLPAGLVLEGLAISEGGDEEIGGSAAEVIAQTIARGEEYKRLHGLKPTGPPMYDADP